MLNNNQNKIDLLKKEMGERKMLKKEEIMNKIKNSLNSYFDKEGKFDIEKLTDDLKIFINGELNTRERYYHSWMGKNYAQLITHEDFQTLIREVKNNNSNNILIKGDNLEALKHLDNVYRNKIKLIYIDPPYNTGNDNYIYSDKLDYDKEEIMEKLNIDEDEADRLLKFIKNDKSNSHSSWLTFMYPRLYYAKHLLKEDGVIFISIDNHELAHLTILMNEIFGEYNYIDTISVVHNLAGRDNNFFRNVNEYLLVYAKNKDKFKIGEFNIDEEEIMKKWNIDEYGYWKKGAQLKRTGVDSLKEDSPNLFYPIYINEKTLEISTIKKEGFDYELIPMRSDGKEGRWRWSKEKLEEEKNYNIIVVKNKKGGFSIYKKQRPELKDLPTTKPKSLFYKTEYSGATSSNIIKKLFNNKKEIFPYTKSPYLIMDIIKIANLKDDDIVLDFFAGSGTTGEAVWRYNIEYNSNIKFILVQKDEEIQNMAKTIYEYVKEITGKDKPTIFDITKERLIRSRKMLLEYYPENVFKHIKDIDMEFNVYELIDIWENFRFETDGLDPNFEPFDPNTMDKDDMKTLLTTWKVYDGIPFNINPKVINLGNNYKAYYFNEYGRLYLIESGFTSDNLVKIWELLDSDKEFEPTHIVIFGYNFESMRMREVMESIKIYSRNNAKGTPIHGTIRHFI